jgi:hypothetical protein
MTARCLGLAAALAAALAVPTSVAAQARSLPRESFSVQGFGLAGVTVFTASETFDAVLDTHRGPIFGGGLRLIVPGGPYLEVGAWRFEQDGQRAFVDASGQVFRLGIPTTVRITPLEVTGGWRFRGLLGRRVTPYVGAGLTSLRYEETSDFAADGEDVSDRFNGFHLTGGVEVRLGRWVALTGDVLWTSVGDAIGTGGVSESFEENDLGGTSVRVRLILGR